MLDNSSFSYHRDFISYRPTLSKIHQRIKFNYESKLDKIKVYLRTKTKIPKKLECEYEVSLAALRSFLDENKIKLSFYKHPEFLKD